MYYVFVGWLVFWVSLIVAIILFAKLKRLYPVFYLASISLYIFTASFGIDIFSLNRLGILTVLVVSAVIFMVLGYYLSTVFGKSDRN